MQDEVVNAFIKCTFFIFSFIFGCIVVVAGLFIRHIIIFDSIIFGIISGVCCKSFFPIHPAFCLLIGLAVTGGMLFLQNTRFGFWIIGVLLSLVWAFIFAFLAYTLLGEDMVWFYVVLGLAFACMMLLHIKAKNMA